MHSIYKDSNYYFNENYKIVRGIKKQTNKNPLRNYCRLFSITISRYFLNDLYFSSFLTLIDYISIPSHTLFTHPLFILFAHFIFTDVNIYLRGKQKQQTNKKTKLRHVLFFFKHILSYQVSLLLLHLFLILWIAGRMLSVCFAPCLL